MRHRCQVHLTSLGCPVVFGFSRECDRMTMKWMVVCVLYLVGNMVVIMFMIGRDSRRQK